MRGLFEGGHMVSFESDYIAGAHPEVLKKLTETNFEALPGYGTDKYCESAKKKIIDTIGLDGLQVEFLAGGTQTNAVVISTMLADYEAVISATTGHISVHEAGAVEYTGNKVISLPGKDGKLAAETVKKHMEMLAGDDSREHMPIPGMVYVSHPTEYGTLYSKAELEALSGVCREYGLKLFLDGARLGYGLKSRETDVTIQDIARLTDVFYIGGTKVGALCGEAVVFTKNNRPPHFMNSVKKRGVLLAKGRLLGVQFDALFTDGLYFRISEHALDMAERLVKMLEAQDVKFFMHSPTNQQFAVLPDAQLASLKEKIAFTFWERYDETHSVVRFATGWSTTEQDIEELAKALKETKVLSDL